MRAGADLPALFLRNLSAPADDIDRNLSGTGLQKPLHGMLPSVGDAPRAPANCNTHGKYVSD